MRSPAEILFRLRQETLNLGIFWRPPRWRGGKVFRLALPALPPVTEMVPDFRPPVAWRRDPDSGVESPLRYFRLIPYLDAARAGDHKKIWDLNRHQEIAVWAWRGETQRAKDLLEDWITANPVHQGMNWTSALEVAFRAISWLYIWHAPGSRMPAAFLDVLYAHGAHLDANLSIYFSPNTHLLGEAVALHALGLFFRNEGWRRRGREVVLDCLRTQVLADGAYFEQSTYYHVYALDFFHLHHRLEAMPAEAQAILGRMAGFLKALLGEAGYLSFLGDDDGGRLFHPFSEASRFGAWTLGEINADPPQSAYPESGLYFLTNDKVQVLFDAGPFARGSAGHSHADLLSFTARTGQREVLIDPGTYTYVGDAAQRELFRSSAMHNTLRVNGMEQAKPAGPFRWRDTPEPRVVSAEAAKVCAEYTNGGGFTHRRTLHWNPQEESLYVKDQVTGPPGRHRIEQFWHFGSEREIERLKLEPHEGFRFQERPELSFRSRRFGRREAAPAFAFQGEAALPCTLTARVYLAPDDTIGK